MTPTTVHQAANVSWDSVGDQLVQIPGEHRRIHQGVFFSISRHTTLGLNATDKILFVTPAGGYAHLLFALRTSLEASFILTEAPTTSAAGTALTPINRNRNSSNTAQAVLTHTPTVSAAGTQLYEMHVGGSRQGGDDRGNNEWLLKPETAYLFTVTSEAAANDVTLFLDWYEA